MNRCRHPGFPGPAFASRLYISIIPISCGTLTFSKQLSVLVLAIGFAASFCSRHSFATQSPLSRHSVATTVATGKIGTVAKLYRCEGWAWWAAGPRVALRVLQ